MHFSKGLRFILTSPGQIAAIQCFIPLYLIGFYDEYNRFQGSANGILILYILNSQYIGFQFVSCGSVSPLGNPDQ